MGTPLRLAAKQVLSPISPFKTPQNVYKRILKPTSRKSLQFTNSPAKTRFLEVPSPNYQSNNKDALIINTPNKLELLHNGIFNKNSINIIGRGTFGTVVRGIYKGEKVAAKIVKINKIEKFSRESNAVLLRHVNLASVKEVLFDKSENYGVILMELYENHENLEQFLDRFDFPLDGKLCLKFAVEICRGVDYCHQNDVLHLDIKPSNVLISENYTCKLCDFGNSYKIGSPASDFVNQGTIIYSAPELLIGSLPTVKCDVYSIGITFWQMKHKILPYRGEGTNEVIVYKVVKFHLRPKVIIEPQSDFCKIYMSCWLPESKNRPKLHDVIENLLQLY